MDELKNIIEEVLEELGLPYYFLQYNGASGKEDPYIVYTFYGYPAHFGDGTEEIRRYTVSFSIHGTCEAIIRQNAEALRSVLIEYDFCPAGDNWWGDEGYPAMLTYTCDFTYDV